MEVEETHLGLLGLSQTVVVDLDGVDSPGLSEHPSLGGDGLSGEDTPHGGEPNVVVETLDVTGQLIHTVDLSAAFDLHGNGRPIGIGTEEIDRPDVSRVLAPDQRQSFLQEIW